MDIRDFEGISKFKLVMLVIYCYSWISMIAGPMFFPVAYRAYTIVVIAYLIFKLVCITLTLIWVNFQGYKIRQKMKRYQKLGRPINSEAQDLLYGFIVPSYNEDVEMIAQTLEILANQRRAHDRYLIFLAMEAHQKGSQNKARELIERFKGRFRVIDLTIHHIRQFQQKGKASNVSWCAQHLQPIFMQYMIDPKDVMLTIIDADSWAPQPYFDQVQQYLNENMQKKDEIIFMPPHIFTRNHLEVPMLTRVLDLTNSYGHTGSMYSIMDFTTPIANYTISYQFIKKIGFWDTCPDAISQDMHTTQKAHWKSEGRLRTKPIYIPFNMVNLATGNGYWEDVKGRFWQSQRHCQGVVEVAYNLNMLFSRSFSLRNWVLTLSAAENFLMSAIVPWVFISLFFQNQVLRRTSTYSQQLQAAQYLPYVLNIVNVLNPVSYVALQYFKRKMNTVIYKRQNQSLVRIIEYCILMPILTFVVTIPTCIIAVFRVIFSPNRQYVLAQKKNTVIKKLESSQKIDIL